MCTSTGHQHNTKCNMCKGVAPAFDPKTMGGVNFNQRNRSDEVGPARTARTKRAAINHIKSKQIRAGPVIANDTAAMLHDNCGQYNIHS